MLPRQRLAQDRARPATYEIHSRRCSQPDRRRSRLPVLVRATRSATAGALPRAAWRSKPNPIDRSVVLELGARSAAEKAKLESILAWLPRNLARLVILAWLWYRLRPTSLMALLRTMLAMRGLRLALRFRSGQIPGMTAATGAPGDA